MRPGFSFVVKAYKVFPKGMLVVGGNQHWIINHVEDSRMLK